MLGWNTIVSEIVYVLHVPAKLTRPIHSVLMAAHIATFFAWVYWDLITLFGLPLELNTMPRYATFSSFETFIVRLVHFHHSTALVCWQRYNV